MSRAFTLIEMLVVIAVIAVLAAILFPVLGQAKRSAKASACVAGLRQFGTAHGLYAADWDDRLAYGCDPWFRWQARKNPEMCDEPPSFLASDLKTLLSAYGIPEPLWRCPEDRVETQSIPYYGAGTYYQAVGGSYRYADEAAVRGASYSVAQPSAWGLMTDAGAFHGGGDAEYFAPGRRANVLFFDLHVRSVAEVDLNGTIPPEGGL